MVSNLEINNGFDVYGLKVVKKNGKVALLCKNGCCSKWHDEIIQGKYLPFPVRSGKRWGYIGLENGCKEPVVIIPFSFYGAECFEKNMGKVEVAPGKYNFVNARGRLQYSIDFDEVYSWEKKQCKDHIMDIGIVGRAVKSGSFAEHKLEYACICHGLISSFRYKTAEEALQAIRKQTATNIFW